MCSCRTLTVYSAFNDIFALTFNIFESQWFSVRLICLKAERLGKYQSLCSSLNKEMCVLEFMKKWGSCSFIFLMQSHQFSFPNVQNLINHIGMNIFCSSKCNSLQKTAFYVTVFVCRLLKKTIHMSSWKQSMILISFKLFYNKMI